MPSEWVGTRVVERSSWQAGVVMAMDLSSYWFNILFDDGGYTSAAPREKFMPEADVAALIRGILARHPETEERT